MPYHLATAPLLQKADPRCACLRRLGMTLIGGFRLLVTGDGKDA